MIKKNSLSFRIISRVLLFTIVFFVLILGIFYYFARNSIEESTRENAVHTADHLVASIETKLHRLEKIPETMAELMKNNPVHPDSLAGVLEEVIAIDPNIYGVFACYEPDFFPDKGRHFCPYVHRDGDDLRLQMVEYDYFYWDWYQVPTTFEQPYWSDPYFGRLGQALMSTYSVPLYIHRNGNRELAGIVALDIALERLTEIVSDVKILETGYAFMLSRSGVLLVHPDSSYIMNESMFSIAEQMELPELREIGRDMIAGKSAFREHGIERDDKLWIYHAPFTGNEWSLGVVYPDNEIFASLHLISSLLLLLIIAGLLLLSIVVYQIIQRQTAPLTLFAESARNVAEGNFQADLPCVTTNDEMKELYDAFLHMQHELARYIEDLKETTAAKEKIESQLRIARDIQLSMVPRRFPAFPDLPQIDLYATLQSAKEVGGDLYNFFMIDNDHLGFTIGDVSDKGVPAALFMAMTNTLIKAHALSGLRPAEVLKKTNYELCQDNEACMFVTLFFGILNIKTGEVEFSNAGHNPFILLTSTDDACYEKMSPGMVLGAFEEAEFVNEWIHLKPMETMFVYTDGVTEAMDKSSNQFGEEKLLEIIKTSGALSTTDMINKTINEVSRFVKGHEQSDDITILALRFISTEKNE